MATSLTGTTAKQKGEAANFTAFYSARPNFAGRALASIQWGGDPPDVLCLDAQGKRIGVELVQWVNERQMAVSKARHKLEESYRLAIRSSYEQPPVNIGMIFIYTKDTLLAPGNAPTFRNELYKVIEAVDAAWLAQPEWDDPQGYPFTDFSAHPCLAQHLERLVFLAHGRPHKPALGSEWIAFEAHGGAYTEQWMLNALLDNIKRKAIKYAKTNSNLKLQQQLDEFYLLAYYDEAVLHNTPYHVPGFGFKEVAAAVARQLAANPHPFNKVFLHSPIETPAVSQVWPII